MLFWLHQTGVYAFSVISIIGTRGGSGYQMILSLVDSIVRLVGTTLQTVFIMEAGTRLLNPKSNSPPYLKHGRETLTFLLLLNFGLWAVDVRLSLVNKTLVDHKGYT